MGVVNELLDLLFRLAPFFAQRADDHRIDQHHDFFGVGVMRADLSALLRVEKALEQRAENRRVDQAPVETRGGDQQANVAGIERHRSPPVEQAAVEMGDLGQVEVAAGFHCGEQAVEIAFGVFGTFGRALEQPWEKSIGQQLHAVCEKAEHELIDEMRDFLGRAAPLQAQRNGREFVRRFPGEAGASLGRPQFVGLVEDRAQDRELLRVGEVVQREFVGFRDGVGPRRANQNAVGVAGHLQRRIFERRGVAHELGEGLVEVALLLLVLPGEEALLPHIGETVAATGLGNAFLEGEPVARRIGLDGIVMAD